MTLYVDSSVLLAIYFAEPRADDARTILEADHAWVSGRHTEIEVRRNLPRALRAGELRAARSRFAAHWAGVDVVELDEGVCSAAVAIAERTGARTLDSLHLGAALRVGRPAFVTFDDRQARSARILGLSVLGV